MTLLDPARPPRLRILLVGCLTLLAPLVLGLLSPPSASAHPFGDPQTIEVSSQDGDVRLRWRAGGTDDLTALALHLGLLPADRVMLDGAVFHEDGDGDLLGVSPAFADYLLERVRVVARGADCPGELLPVTDLVSAGAVLSFDCGTAVDVVEVEARTLTDLHPAYRSLASGPEGQRAVYDDEHPTHSWTLTGAPVAGSSARSAAVQLGPALGVVLAGGVGGAFYLRRRSRSKVEPAA